MIIHLDPDKARAFINECTFIGPNAEAVRDAIIEAMNRSPDDPRNFVSDNPRASDD